MPLFRCLNPKCPGKARKPKIRDFESDASEPVCPVCGAGKDDPSAVRGIVPIHYLANTPLSVGPIKTGAGGRMVACTPKATKIPKHATALPRAVTCPRCLASEILKQHVASKVNQHVPFIENANAGKPTAKNVRKVPVGPKPGRR
jgi:rubredoxin